MGARLPAGPWSDQQAVAPGDRAFEYVISQANTPVVWPTKDWFIFTAKLWTRTAEASEQGIYLGSLDSPAIQKLLPDLSSAVYAPPGYLVFAREGRLMAAPFDLAAGRVTGTPAPIGGTVATDGSMYFAAVSASADGTLAVRPPPAVALVTAPWSEANVLPVATTLALQGG